jgi:uncharacterized repeat protein (TIGR01451 family)
MATGVVLAEHVPETMEHPAGAELEYEIGDLGPGESRDLDLTLSAVKAGAAANLLIARGDGQLQAEQKSPIFVVAPALAVALDGPKKRYLDRQATYTVSVSNPGTAAAEEIELVTYLPPGMEFVEANNSGVYDPQAHAVHWLLEELPPSKQGSVVVSALPVEAGDHTLRVVSTARGGLTAEAREAVSVEGVAALNFQVLDLVDPVEIGGETEYEIRVVNQGSKAATNVELTLLLPPEMKILSAEGPTRYDSNAQQVRFQALPRLAPKTETSYRLKVQGTAAGDLRIRAQLRSDDITTPITKEESTRVYADQ